MEDSGVVVFPTQRSKFSNVRDEAGLLMEKDGLAFGLVFGCKGSSAHSGLLPMR